MSKIIDIHGKDVEFERFKTRLGELLGGDEPKDEREKALADLLNKAKQNATQIDTYLEAVVTAWMLYTGSVAWLQGVLNKKVLPGAIKAGEILSTLSINLMHEAVRSMPEAPEGETNAEQTESAEGEGEDTGVSGIELGPKLLD